MSHPTGATPFWAGPSPNCPPGRPTFTALGAFAVAATFAVLIKLFGGYAIGVLLALAMLVSRRLVARLPAVLRISGSKKLSSRTRADSIQRSTPSRRESSASWSA